jgi:predicted membrane protein
MKINSIINHSLKRKLVTAVFITVSVAAFAAHGDVRKDEVKKTHQKSLLSIKSNTYNFKNFSLKSRYNFRGSTILSIPQDKYITLNTVATYQKGNTIYILPMKKKVLLDKVKFNPAH